MNDKNNTFMLYNIKNPAFFVSGIFYYQNTDCKSALAGISYSL